MDVNTYTSQMRDVMDAQINYEALGERYWNLRNLVESIGLPEMEDRDTEMDRDSRLADLWELGLAAGLLEEHM